MSLILTYEDELYKEPDYVYKDENKVIKVIPKYDKDVLENNITYKDFDLEESKFNRKQETYVK